MSKLSYEIRKAVNDPFDDYTGSEVILRPSPLNDAEFIVSETEVEGQVYYKKKIKDKLKLGSSETTFFLNEISNCYKYYINIFKFCNGSKKFIFRAQFSVNNISFDLDQCTCEIDLQNTSPYECLEKNRTLLVDYLLETGSVEVTQQVKLDNTFTETYRAEDLLRVVNVVLRKLYCRGFDGNVKADAINAVSDFFNWHKEPGSPNDQNYKTRSYIYDGDFLTGPGPGTITEITNYVNPSDDPYHIFIGLKSDAINPTASNPASKFKISFADIEEMLKEVFNVYWILESEICIRFEHFSWFVKNVNYDAITATNFPFNKNKNKFKINQDDFPASETWEFVDHSNTDFIGMPIKYPQCSNGKFETRGFNKLTTDIAYLYNKFAGADTDDLTREGFVLYDVYTTYTLPRTAPYYVVKVVGYISSVNQFNNRLSTGNFHVDLHKHNRPFDSGTMNNSATTFLSKVYKKEQENIVVKNCCVDENKPEESLVKTELGNGKIVEKEINYSKDTIKFKLKHD